jgi:methenyltetrahydrofolate cyclohydrolase
MTHVEDKSIKTWLDELADRTPTPGGGAAAALLAATSAALICMVSIYTTGPKWSDREERMREINTEAKKLQREALLLSARDAEAFAQVGTAYGMPRSTQEEKDQRSAAIQRALIGAAQPPVDTGNLAVRIVELTVELVESGNKNVISDVAVAAASAEAALYSAIVNIEINAGQIKDADIAARLAEDVQRFTSAISSAQQVVRDVREELIQ